MNPRYLRWQTTMELTGCSRPISREAPIDANDSSKSKYFQYSLLGSETYVPAVTLAYS
jgi:hypothetical protein